MTNMYLILFTLIGSQILTLNYCLILSAEVINDPEGLRLKIMHPLI